MSVILISGDCFSGERTLAVYVADILDYRYVDEDVVVERAAVSGTGQRELREALGGAPGFFDRFLHNKRIPAILVQAAAAEEIREGRAVCHGNIADLLLREEARLLRVRVTCSLESRIDRARELRRFDRMEATAYVRAMDRSRSRRLRRLFGSCWRNPSRFDLEMDLDAMDSQEAALKIAALARKPAPTLDAAVQASLENLAISCRIKAAFALDPATAHLELSASCDDGRASILGELHTPDEAAEVQRVAIRVPGVSEVDLSEIGLRNPEANAQDVSEGPFDRRMWRPALAVGSTLAGVLALALLTGKLWQGTEPMRSASSLGSRTIQGLITDTLCAGAHQPGGTAAQCIRACVGRGGGVRYALYDGRSVYVLSDQHTAQHYAAQRVSVKGALEGDSHRFRVESVKALAPD